MRRAELVLHHNPAPRADVMLMKTVEEAHGPPSPKKTKQKKKLSSLSLCGKRAKGGVTPNTTPGNLPTQPGKISQHLQHQKKTHFLKVSHQDHVAEELQDLSKT